MNFKKQLASRLKKELTAVQRSPPFGITVYLPDDNLHVWNAEIKGPAGSLYEGGTFKIQITLPENYPMEPPVIHFLTSIYHLNVSQSCGQVCLGFLSNDAWSAAGTMEQVLNAVYSLLIKPEEDNAFDHDVLNTYHHFTSTYNSNARQSALKAK